MNFQTELYKLRQHQLLPNKSYISRSRFTSHFENSGDFWVQLGKTVGLPIVNALYAFAHAVSALWSLLRAVGNLLIVKPKFAGDAFGDMRGHFVLSLGLAVMAPIHVLTFPLEVLARTLTSWFVGEEPVEDLSRQTLFQKFSQIINEHPETLPSKVYFTGQGNNSRFFSPYQSAWAPIAQFVSPITIIFKSALHAITQALEAVLSTINLVTNLLICKPRHALEDLRDVTVGSSLAIALALMTPVNALVEAGVFVTRLGTTWVHACMDEPNSNPEAEYEYKAMAM